MEIKLTFDSDEWARIKTACATNAGLNVENITDDTVKNMVIFQCHKSVDSYVRYTPIEIKQGKSE